MRARRNICRSGTSDTAISSIEGARPFVKRRTTPSAAAPLLREGFRRSRNDPLTPKIREHPKKHLRGVHQVVESEAAGLAGIGDDIVVGSEHAVRVAPG